MWTDKETETGEMMTGIRTETETGKGLSPAHMLTLQKDAALFSPRGTHFV